LLGFLIGARRQNGGYGSRGVAFLQPDPDLVELAVPLLVTVMLCGALLAAAPAAAQRPRIRTVGGWSITLCGLCLQIVSTARTQPGIPPRTAGGTEPPGHAGPDLAGLHESIEHDYSTSDAGIVPLNRRRPLWHFAGLWTTFSAGFTFLFLGFALHDGHSLASVAGITAIGFGCYAGYAMFAAYLGSRTGQTSCLLTRSVFGRGGSWLVSAFVLVAPLGWIGFQAGLMVQIWDGLFGWGHVFGLTLALGGLMIVNNLFGFTGISVFARYVVAPLIILWIVLLTVKAFATDWHALTGTPPGPGLPYWLAVTSVVGFAVWGNEPDVWRYGRPRFWWPLWSFLFAGFWFVLFTAGGWMMAQLANSADFGVQVKFITGYSLFGAFWLAWLLATTSQFAINDGNYYESINAGQNLFGTWRRWRRPYTCLIVAAGGVIAAWLVNYHVLDGWFKVAGFLAISVPCATVIMAVDHFLLPRIFRISRPLVRVPSWSEAGPLNIPAVVALLASVAFGVIGLADLPNGWIYSSPPTNWGPVPVEAWLLAGVVYLVGVAVARAAAADVRIPLGFAEYITSDEAIAATPVDLAAPSSR
jgi:purine-cytosine permease-like protein